MANISTENINTLAQLAASISDGDYIYIYKSSSNSFARIEKSVFLSGIAGGGATSSKTKANVNALQAKIDELIGVLAPLAYNGNIPSQIGALDWDEDVEPGTPVLTSPNGASVNVGGHNGSGVSKSILVKGSNLTQALSVSISGTGFSASTNSVSAANANSGTYISVTYNGTQSSASGTLTISSSEVSVNVPLTASYSESVTTHDVTINSSGLSHCSYSHNMGNLTAVVDGGSVEITISPSSNYTLLGVSASATATNGSVTQSYDSTNDRIIVTVSNITADTTITIGATAVAQGGEQEEDGYVTDNLVLHLDCKDWNGSGTWNSKVGNIGFTLENCSKEQNGDGVVFNGETSNGSYGITDLPSGFPNYSNCTIEIYVKGFRKRNKSTAIKANVSDGLMLGYWNYGQKEGFVGAVSESNQKYAPYTPSSPFNGYIGFNQSRCVVNGIVVADDDNPSKPMSSLGDTFSFPNSLLNKITLGRNFNSGGTADFTAMTVFAIRVYDEKLSASDMMRNYNEDVDNYGSY